MTAAVAETSETNKKKKRRQRRLIFPVLITTYIDNNLRWLDLAPTATILLSVVICCCSTPSAAAAEANTAFPQITKGFSITPSPQSSFQPILKDPSGNFSFGFLFLRGNHLDLAVVHLPSSLPLWRANAKRARTAPTTTLSFDGRLLLSDTRSGNLYWSPRANGTDADRVLLLDTSNLQIRARSGDMVWQSFDVPSDTIVQDQNFTSNAQLHDAGDKGVSMRLGPNYLGLFFMVRIMYWKQTAFEASAEIVDGKGPIYARINASSGYMALYQQEGLPVHVIPFDSYNRNITVVYLRRLTLESDGNLRGYYWNGVSWVPDYKAISSKCDLPTACGPYALCTQKGTGGTCSCLDHSETCLPRDRGDLCTTSPTRGASSGYRVLRRTGVDLAYKEYMESTKADSMEDCEASCARNCSCWGAIYSNATGACYKMDFPIETVVAGGGKMGYFKVRVKAGGRGGDGKMAVGIAVLVVVLAIVIGIGILGAHRGWGRRWRRGLSRSRTGAQGTMLAEGLTPVPYKDLKHTSSFRSVQLSVPPPRQ